MVTRKPKIKKMTKCNWDFDSKCDGGFAYVLGFLGAAFYYVSTATGVWGGIVGVLKALVWPAFLVHALLKFIGA